MTIQDRNVAGGEMLWFGNTLAIVRLSALAGADGISVVEHRMPYGESPPLHIHRNQDEVFYILEGTMRFRVDGKDRIAHAGETVLAPKGIPHTFRVESVGGAVALTTTVGPDFETMMRETSIPADRLALPEQREMTPAVAAMLGEACARNGIDLIGAPLA